MDISTRQVISQTLSTTNAHVEVDHLVNYEEKIADVSIEYKAYNDYDMEEIPVDTSVSKEDIVKMRHTHLYLESVDSSTYFKDLTQWYIDSSIYPVPFFFKG